MTFIKKMHTCSIKICKVKRNIDDYKFLFFLKFFTPLCQYSLDSFVVDTIRVLDQLLLPGRIAQELRLHESQID